jgi:glycosyltransferase involved in cell wall biosynthesis
MRILELGKFYPPHRGGMETLLGIWSEGFAALGAEVDCVVANDAPRTVHETIRGVRVHRLASYGTMLSTSLCPAYLKATGHWPADLWHMHAPNPLADLACLRGPPDVPLVISYHSDVIRQSAWLSLYGPLLRRLLHRADRILVATPLHIEHSPWLRPVRSKCEVIPFGIDLDRFKATPAATAAAAQFRAPAAGKPVILTIGRLVEYKGIRFLIEAMQHVDAELWIIGTGPLESSLRDQAREAGIGGRVHFLGKARDEEVTARLHACDVFVLPSITRNEAFGLVQAEAMACGKPVVSCALDSGVPWVNQDGVTGLVVPPADSGALAIALRRLLGEDALRRRLGEAGAARAVREFDQRVMVRRYWQCFESLAHRRSRSDDV